VTNLGTLGTDTIRHAHTLLESGHARGKLVLTVDGPPPGSAHLGTQ
jgi:hypothetical protein